jgi:hypothetical protein
MIANVAVEIKTETQNGADAYLRAMQEEAEDSGQPIDWHEIDSMYQDCLDVDVAQAEFTDWRG